jgi:diguanylate cyclase (GGDEF)-like protein
MQKKIPVTIFMFVLLTYFAAQTSLTFFEFSVQAKIVGINGFLAVLQFISVFYVLRSDLGQLANKVLAFGFFVVGLASSVRVFGILATGEDIYAADQDFGQLFFIFLAVVNITEGFTCLGALLIDRIDLVSKQALTDPLTNCLNRRGFDEIVQQTFEKARRGNNQTVLIVADLDRFKRINDTYGHGAGDNTIRLFAEIFTEEIRTVDHLGRLGGEEFIILLWQTDLNGAKELVTRIRTRLSQTKIAGLPEPFRVTSSFGATVVETDETDINAIIHRADLALYQAKNNGRDQLRCLTKEQEQQAQQEFDNLEKAKSVA